LLERSPFLLEQSTFSKTTHFLRSHTYIFDRGLCLKTTDTHETFHPLSYTQYTMFCCWLLNIPSSSVNITTDWWFQPEKYADHHPVYWQNYSIY
jgi:hypothetical protein